MKRQKKLQRVDLFAKEENIKPFFINIGLVASLWSQGMETNVKKNYQTLWRQAPKRAIGGLL